MTIFLLPLLVALCGRRISRWLLGKEFASQFGFGLQLCIGLAVGMLVFSQLVLFGALSGLNLTEALSQLLIVWASIELVVIGFCHFSIDKLRQFHFTRAHWWWLLLFPVVYSWWIFAHLSMLEGTLEFDANAFWVFKAKMLYLQQGHTLVNTMHDPQIGYAHMDYPVLVPSLYALGYGASGHVNEFINNIWPLWMVMLLSWGILSLGQTWQRPRPLPIAIVTLFCFLPASLQYIRGEGGTMPMVFYSTLAAILLVRAIVIKERVWAAAGLLALTGGAMCKQEGVIYAGLWGLAMLLFCWQQGWLKQLWKTAVAAVLCVLPYVWMRLDKPVLHPESHWIQGAITHPGLTLHLWYQAFYLNIVSRFVSHDAAQWSVVGPHHSLQWAGQWAGWQSFVAPQIACLSWLLLAIIALTLYQKNYRPAVSYASTVMVGFFIVMAFAEASLLSAHTNWQEIVFFTYPDIEGRYSYPFITAWCISLLSLWFIPLTKKVT